MFGACVCMYNMCVAFGVVLERPSSQMSYLDQFLKETNSNQQQQQSQHSSQQFDQQTASVQAMLYHGGSIESEEGDIEDNRALSIASSKSNLSEISMVSQSESFYYIFI